MATINLGNIKFNWKGTYNAGTAYAVDDVVSYNGSSYVCILASTGNLPTNTTYWNVMSEAGTDGTDLTSTLTTQGDIVYRDASGLARLGAGTSGQVLQTGGTGANPSWTTMSSDVVKVASWDYSSSASSVTLSNVFSNDYDVYKVFFINMFASANTQLEWRLLTSSGSASGDYDTTRLNSFADDSGANAGHSYSTQWNASYVRPTPENVSTTIANSQCTELTLFNPYKTGKRRQYHMHSFVDASNGYNYQFLGAGFNDDTSNNYTQLEFRFEGGGNVAGGSVRAYGYKN